MGLWIADQGAGLICPPAQESLCAHPLCLCACGDTVVCASQGSAQVYSAGGESLASYPLPPGVRCMLALPGALYCLSGEADSLSLLCPMTGQLRLCTQAGCDPRDLAISPCRRLLAAAGGASGMLYLYHCPSLMLARSIPLPGIVYAVCFRGEELTALCAVETGEINTCLCHISVRGVVSELLRLPGLPGALLSLPNGGLLAGALGQLLYFRADLRLFRRIHCGLPSRLRLYRDYALCVDSLEGRVTRIDLRNGTPIVLYRGEAVDAICI